MTCGTETPRCGCGRPDTYESNFGRMCRDCYVERKREAEAAFHYQENVVNEIKYQIAKHLGNIAKDLATAPLSRDRKFVYRISIDMPGSLPIDLVINGYQQAPVFSWMNHITGQIERS